MTSLRHLPPAAFCSIDWDSFIPHLWSQASLYDTASICTLYEICFHPNVSVCEQPPTLSDARCRILKITRDVRVLVRTLSNLWIVNELPVPSVWIYRNVTG
jgi:hypothetical protein